MRWTGHVARIRRRGTLIFYWLESHVEIDHYADQDVGGDDIKTDFGEVGWGNGPPLWSNGQSSWLQIRRPGFDSRHYQIF
jgi:hypothetical protein